MAFARSVFAAEAMTTSETYTQFITSLGIGHDAPWLRRPASEDEIRQTERELGSSLPEDLVDLLRLHNGGRLLDVHEWIGCTASAKRNLSRASSWFNTEMMHEFRSQPDALGSITPGPTTLLIAQTSHNGILYDTDTVPGRLLCYDVMSTPAVRVLANSLDSLLACFVELAQAGCIELTEIGPLVGMPTPVLFDILEKHDVYL